MPKYATLHIHPDVKEELLKVIFDVTSRAGRRVTISDAIHALVLVSQKDMDGLASALEVS